MNGKIKSRLRRNAKAVTVCAVIVFAMADPVQMVGDTAVVEGIQNTSSLVEASKTIRQTETVEGEVDGETNDDSAVGISGHDSYLLAKIAMAEAEGEDTEGKTLVIAAILNRVENGSFPDTVEEVILEEHGGVYQFSTAQKGGRYWTVEPDTDCYVAVGMVMNGWDESDGALYFESKSDSTWHQENLEFLFKHGNHYFYR